MSEGDQENRVTSAEIAYQSLQQFVWTYSISSYFSHNYAFKVFSRILVVGQAEKEINKSSDAAAE